MSQKRVTKTKKPYKKKATKKTRAILSKRDILNSKARRLGLTLGFEDGYYNLKGSIKGINQNLWWVHIEKLSDVERMLDEIAYKTKTKNFRVKVTPDLIERTKAYRKEWDAHKFRKGERYDKLTYKLLDKYNLSLAEYYNSQFILGLSEEKIYSLPSYYNKPNDLFKI